MIPVFFVGLFGIGKTTIIFKSKHSLITTLKEMGYNVNGYSLDNYEVYDNASTFHAQIERMHYGSRKLKEAVEESPKIALFDRSLFCNILFSKCFCEFGIITEREFNTIQKVFTDVKYRETCFDGHIFFLDPPIAQVLKQVKERNNNPDPTESRDGKINNILLNEDFIHRLHEIYREFYEQYKMTNPVYRLEKYDENIILKEMKKHDIIQIITD